MRTRTLRRWNLPEGTQPVPGQQGAKGSGPCCDSPQWLCTLGTPYFQVQGLQPGIGHTQSGKGLGMLHGSGPGPGAEVREARTTS